MLTFQTHHIKKKYQESTEFMGFYPKSSSKLDFIQKQKFCTILLQNTTAV